MDHGSKCVYCNEQNPFTDEHVFPAGMGGDDHNYLLKASVCGICNNKFSKFESTLMRRSLVAMSRIYLQPTGRDKKSKPEFDAIESHQIDESGVALETVITHGLTAETLPQLIISGDKITGTAKDVKVMELFLEKANAMFAFGELRLIEKSINGYEVSLYQLSSERYELVERFFASKPPKMPLVWLKFGPGITRNNEAIDPRFFQRHQGQFVLRTHDSSTIDKILYKVRQAIPLISKDLKNNTVMKSSGAQVSSSVLGWSEDCSRAVAKIGFNFLIHMFGNDFARGSAFNKIKRLILKRFPKSIQVLGMGDEQKNVLFEGVPPDNHCSIIATLLRPDGKTDIIFCALLYGVTAVRVVLAQGVVGVPYNGLNYFLTNYKEHSTRRFDAHEYILSNNPYARNMLRLFNAAQNNYVVL